MADKSGAILVSPQPQATAPRLCASGFLCLIYSCKATSPDQLVLIPARLSTPPSLTPPHNAPSVLLCVVASLQFAPLNVQCTQQAFNELEKHQRSRLTFAGFCVESSQGTCRYASMSYLYSSSKE